MAAEILTGSVLAWVVVRIEAKANSFQAKMKQKPAVAAMPPFTIGSTSLREGVHARVAVDDRDLLDLPRHAVEEALHDPGREADIGEDRDEDRGR